MPRRKRLSELIKLHKIFNFNSILPVVDSTHFATQQSGAVLVWASTSMVYISILLFKVKGWLLLSNFLILVHGLLLKLYCIMQ
jgi:hypothetical protein